MLTNGLKKTHNNTFCIYLLQLNTKEIFSIVDTFFAKNFKEDVEETYPMQKIRQ